MNLEWLKWRLSKTKISWYLFKYLSVFSNEIAQCKRIWINIPKIFVYLYTNIDNNTSINKFQLILIAFLRKLSWVNIMFIVHKVGIVLNLYAILLAYQYVIITLVLPKWLRILKFDINELQNLHVTFIS